MVMDLSSRIKLINKQNEYLNSQPKETDEQEQLGEDNLLAAVEETWANQQAIEEKETSDKQVTLADIYKEAQEIKAMISDHNDLLSKINKHINATQKMLKKGSK